MAAATPPPAADTSTVETAIAKALVPYGRMPSSAEEVAALTDDLLTYGQEAMLAVQALDEASRAPLANTVRTWEYLTAAGPTDNAAGVANWTYARSLARVVRTLTAALRETRAL